ncbi:hypothetical protein M5K25_014821 [Dendrobium thyrsiflorum]|uniref:Arp2/3 complex 34 kDa subunit n=1 Tax=Dendrobium thyrsiflorum TaxID=117978 RepID=A0ABD0UVP6_DENTH
MILLQSASRFLLQILQNRLISSEKSVDLDCHSVEFDDVRYHIQFSVKSPQVMLLSISLPIPPPETVFVNGLPLGAIEAVKGAYGELVQILDPPKDGYNLTMKLNFTKLPQDEGRLIAFMPSLLRQWMTIYDTQTRTWQYGYDRTGLETSFYGFYMSSIYELSTIGYTRVRRLKQ